MTPTSPWSSPASQESTLALELGDDLNKPSLVTRSSSERNEMHWRAAACEREEEEEERGGDRLARPDGCELRISEDADPSFVSLPTDKQKEKREYRTMTK